MHEDKKGSHLDFGTAASLYSLGKLSIKEAAKIAEEFRYQTLQDGKLGASSSQSPDKNVSTDVNKEFELLRGPALQISAKGAILALAQGLVQETTDPFKDIFEVRNFVLAVSDFLSEDEFDRAGIFVELGERQSELGDLDPQGNLPESGVMREDIRQAAIDYLNNPLSKVPE